MSLPHIIKQENGDGSYTVTLEVDGNLQSIETFATYEAASAEERRLMARFRYFNASFRPFKPKVHKMFLHLDQDGNLVRAVKGDK